MNLTAKGPKPDKAHERISLGRLEIIHLLIKDQQTLLKKTADGKYTDVWDWRNVLEKLVVPCMNHKDVNVRWMASAIIQ